MLALFQSIFEAAYLADVERSVSSQIKFLAQTCTYTDGYEWWTFGPDKWQRVLCI